MPRSRRVKNRFGGPVSPLPAHVLGAPFRRRSGAGRSRRVAATGAKGLKLHPNTQGFDVADDEIRATVQLAGDLGLPVLFYAFSPFDADQPGKFLTLALSCPSTQIILAHMHHTRFLDLLVYDVMAKYPWWTRNVWFDMSVAAAAFAGSPYQDQFAWVCRKLGTDRLLVDLFGLG